MWARAVDFPWMRAVDAEMALALLAMRLPVSGIPAAQPAACRGKVPRGEHLRLGVWDMAGNRWADPTYTLHSDGTLTGRWSSGDEVQHATLKKQP